MTTTNQLSACYAALQLNELRRTIVMTHQPTLDLLDAEFEERLEGVPKHTREWKDAAKRRAEHVADYRHAVVLLQSAIARLRRDCGADPTDLPEGDADVNQEAARIRAAHAADVGGAA
jgi:hypothetical protein